MKFEKLSEDTLKITLGSNELPNSNNLDEFMTDSSNARNTFLNLLDKANDEVGFITKDYKVKIDAQALYNGNFILTFTRLMHLKSNRIIVHPKKIQREKILSDFSIYRFENFEDFCNFCTYLNNHNIDKLSKIANYVKLYLLNNNYYLVFYRLNKKYENYVAFFSTIVEFCKYYSSKELFISTLNERGTLTLDNNALITCQKYFI
jgi:negative regulator of genetic competence, sporulation and motility